MDGFLYNTTAVPPSTKSRNNSKESMSYYNKTGSNQNSASLTQGHKLLRGTISNKISPKNKNARKFMKIKSNYVKQPPIMPPGIKSTLSSLNMKIGNSSPSDFASQQARWKIEAKKPPKSKIIENKRFSKKSLGSTNKKVSVLLNLILF